MLVQKHGGEYRPLAFSKSDCCECPVKAFFMATRSRLAVDLAIGSRVTVTGNKGVVSWSIDVDFERNLFSLLLFLPAPCVSLLDTGTRSCARLYILFVLSLKPQACASVCVTLTGISFYGFFCR